jgi:hypothetical protein
MTEIIHNPEDHTYKAVDAHQIANKLSKGSHMKFKNRLWNNISAVVFILVVAGIGTYLLVSSHAAAPSVTKVWSTTADWNSGKLSNGTAVRLVMPRSAATMSCWLQ